MEWHLTSAQQAAHKSVPRSGFGPAGAQVFRAIRAVPESLGNALALNAFRLQPSALHEGVMSSRPWMPLYVGDYLSKTSHLTTLQHGAYMLLIMHYWSNGGLPTTDRELMAIARMTEDQWVSNCQSLAKFFTIEWRHKRLDEEILKTENIKRKRAIAGLKGAFSKHKSHREQFLANANTITVTNIRKRLADE